MLEFNINVIGPPAQKNIPDVLRYEPGFSVDLLADLALPIGEYNSDQSLNIGQNRWYGRLGMPIIWQFGAWVPGRRTTLEFLPAVWLFGDNDDYVGQTLETDPMFQLDAHLTRDFTEHLWGSLDAAWYSGGQATINGVQGEKLDNLGIGLTLGYVINDNLNLTVGYKSTINDDAPGDLSMDGFMATLVFGWHPLVEGSRRLKEEKQVSEYFRKIPEAAYHAALDLQPAFTQAAVNLADLNLDAARRSARRLAELEPDDPEVRVLLRQVDAAAP